MQVLLIDHAGTENIVVYYRMCKSTQLVDNIVDMYSHTLRCL